MNTVHSERFQDFFVAPYNAPQYVCSATRTHFYYNLWQIADFYSVFFDQAKHQLEVCRDLQRVIEVPEFFVNLFPAEKSRVWNHPAAAKGTFLLRTGPPVSFDVPGIVVVEIYQISIRGIHAVLLYEFHHPADRRLLGIHIIAV